jgi:hypothetical protein
MAGVVPQRMQGVPMMFDEAGESVGQCGSESSASRSTRTAMLNAFRTESPQLVLRIQSGSIEGRHQHVRHCARYLRSVSLEIGATSLADACGEIEQAAAMGDGEIPVEVLHDLFVHWLAAITVLGGDSVTAH